MAYTAGMYNMRMLSQHSERSATSVAHARSGSTHICRCSPGVVYDLGAHENT